MLVVDFIFAVMPARGGEGAIISPSAEKRCASTRNPHNRPKCASVCAILGRKSPHGGTKAKYGRRATLSFLFWLSEYGNRDVWSFSFGKWKVLVATSSFPPLPPITPLSPIDSGEPYVSLPFLPPLSGHNPARLTLGGSYRRETIPNLPMRFNFRLD